MPLLRSLLGFAAAAAAAVPTVSAFQFPLLPHAKPEARFDRDPAVDGTMPEDYAPALKQMIDTAVTQSPQLIADAINIDIANAQKLYDGIGPMLPQINGSIQYGTQDSQVAGNSSANSKNTGLQYQSQGNQAIFHWGQLRDRLNQKRIGVAISEREYATAYQLFINDLRRQYLSLIYVKLQVRNAHFVLAGAQRNLAYIRQQLKAGAATGGMEQGARLGEADLHLQADQQDDQYAFAKRQLAREVGVKQIDDDQILDAVPEPHFAADAAGRLLAEVLRTGARYTGETQIKLLQIRQSKFDYDYWKVNLLPLVDLQTNLNQFNSTNATPTSVTQTAVTQEDAYVIARWNIFDGFQTRGHKEEALLRRRQAERELKIRTEEAMDRAQTSEHTVEFAWRALQTATERAAIAHGQLALAQQERERGNGTEETVAGALKADYDQQYNLAFLRTNFLMAWSDFVGITGHDPALSLLPARYVRPVE